MTNATFPANSDHMGRPSTYSDEIASEILLRLSNGETLRAICRSEHMPPESTVRLWVVDDAGPGFAAHYARARDVALDVMADEIIEISDDGTGDRIMAEGRDGRMIEIQDHEFSNRSKLRVDTRKWYLSKMAPKRYGDKLTLDGQVDVGFGDRLASARKASE